MDTLLIGLEVFPICLILTMATTKIILPRLRRAHAGQFILEIGPAWHKTKEGTPTMGGIAPLCGTIVTGVIFALYLSLRIKADMTPWLLTLLFALGNACVGMVDDMTKIRHAKNQGLTPWQKLILQSALVVAYILLLRIRGVATTRLPIPFFGITLDFGWFWYPFFFLVLIWFVNCANLTDGIDGLASSVSGVIGVFFLFMARKTDNLSLTLAAATLAGGAFGFFAFNRHPAKIFMGDTGSLFFGGLISGCAMISGSPLLLFLTAFVFFIEGVSVVLQVVWFKLTHGHRLFKMAPLHHHFEKCGMGEWTITLIFTLLTALMSFLAYWGITNGI